MKKKGQKINLKPILPIFILDLIQNASLRSIPLSRGV
jgi:hypothetical protein